MAINFSDLSIGDSLWCYKDGYEYFIDGLDKVNKVIASLYYFKEGSKIYTTNPPPPYDINTFTIHKKNRVDNWRKRLENGI